MWLLSSVIIKSSNLKPPFNTIQLCGPNFTHFDSLPSSGQSWKFYKLSIFCHVIPFGLVFKVIQQFSLNILWFPSDYSTFTSCYFCSQSPHQTENFLTTTLRKCVDLTTTLKGVYYLLSLPYYRVIIILFFISSSTLQPVGNPATLQIYTV